MSYKLESAILVAFLLLFAKGQNDSTTKSPPDIILVKFELNHTLIPELTRDLITSLDYKNFTNETIYLKDLLHFVVSSNVNFSTINSKFPILKDNFNVTFYIDKIEMAFKALNLSINDIYESFEWNYKGAKANIINALNALNLNSGNITGLKYQLDKVQAEIDFFNEIKNGNYSKYNVDKFLSELNFTSDEFMDTFINLVGNKSMDDIIKLERSYANILAQIFQNLSIESNNYANYAPFKTILTNYTDKANAEGILAIAYKPNSFITLDGPWRKNKNLRIVGEVHKDNATSVISNLTADIYHNQLVSLLSSNNNNSYANITKNYTSVLNNCSVVIYGDGQLIKITPQHIKIDEQYLWVQFENEIYPNISSPLICNDTIYGLSTSKNVSGLWQFESFKIPSLTSTESSTQLIGSSTSVHVSQSKSTEPTSTEPTSTKLTSTEPMSTEPTSTESTSTESTSTEPTSTEPTSTKTTSNGRVLMSTALNIIILCLLVYLL